MNESREQQRNRRKPALAVDALEERRVLSAGMGSTFAIVPGVIAEAGQTSSSEVRLDTTHFTPGARGRIVVGIDVAADPGSSVKPEVTAVRSATGRNLGFQRSMYSQTIVKSQGLLSPRSSAVTATLTTPKEGQAPVSYKVDVRGMTSANGAYLLGFYLPGDADGDGLVSRDDVQKIATLFGRSSTDDGYEFDADANRDGKIDMRDLRMAGQNVGAKTIISPVTSVNLDPASDSGISDRITNQRVVKFKGTASPNSQITFVEAAGKSPGGTTTVGADGNYTIDVQLGDGSNSFKVTAADAFGQVISGSIAAVTYSNNPPTLTNTIPTVKST
ncbi:Ig-like domain-containing protein [Paludisphaera soli]|uniref:Ig-like domain-containing protein n=1 Tax=Paludisphaera soli TaxID=2712865 RepID=UPI0013EBD37D|nr:Ig-like domain-containing protein [Paludisphaera soli]